MKRFGFVAASLMLAAVFSVASFGQAAPATKIAVIDSGAFAVEQSGIGKFINAVKSVNTEFAPRSKELNDMGLRLQKIADELKAMTSNTAVPLNEVAARAKQDEGEKLQREFEYKKKDFEESYNRRLDVVTGPIQSDIGKAIQEYAIKNGFSVVFDLDKLAGNALILAWDQKTDITKEFIAYYNTRPAPTATAAKPN